LPWAEEPLVDHVPRAVGQHSFLHLLPRHTLASGGIQHDQLMAYTPRLAQEGRPFVVTKVTVKMAREDRLERPVTEWERKRVPRDEGEAILERAMSSIAWLKSRATTLPGRCVVMNAVPHTTSRVRFGFKEAMTSTTAAIAKNGTRP